MTPTRGPRNNSGGQKAPRWPNGNIDWERVLDEFLKPIIAGQIAPNTNRGFMYILESKGILKKSDYDGLTDHLVQWRKSGEIRWDDVADGSGRGIINDFPHFQELNAWINNKIDFLRNGGEYYRKLLDTQWRWFGQLKYVMYMMEKHAVAGTVAAHTLGNYVKVAYNRGDSGWGYMEKMCRELKKERYYTDLDTGKETERDAIYLKYMGDDDKYGHHMDELIKEQVEFFGLSDILKFQRIVVVPSQIREYGLPVDFETGKGYEIDALNAFNPQKFRRLLIENITPHFDESIHEKLLEQNPARLVDQMIRKKVKFLSEHSSKPERKPKRSGRDRRS